MEMKKITVTNERIVNMLNGLIRFGDDECPSDLYIDLAKNMHILRLLANDIIGANKPSNKYKEYTRKLGVLNQSFSLKDAKGRPTKGEGGLVMDPDRIDNYDNKIDALERKNQECIDKETERRIEYAETLKNEQTFSIYKIPWGSFKGNAKPNIIEMFIEIME